MTAEEPIRTATIHNGDHAEYEIENAGKPPQERSDWPLPSFNARDWAEAFLQTYESADDDFLEVGTMTGWFANAIMCGFDEASRRDAATIRDQKELYARLQEAWVERGHAMAHYRATISDLKAQNAAQAEEIERLRKRTHEIAERENARAGKAEGKLLVLERDRINAREYLTRPAMSGARFSRYIEEGIADFLHGEYNLTTENAELRARVEDLENMIVAETKDGDSPTFLAEKASIVRARLEAGKQ